MRRVTGAVLNHVLLMKTKGMFICIVLAVAAMVVYLVTNNEIARVASVWVFLLLIPLTTLNSSNVSFDSKWNRIEKLWDVPPFIMIAARYIVYAAISVALSAIWVLSPFHDGNMQNIVDAVTLVLLTGAMYYPVMYLLNSDHNMGMIVIFFAMAAAFMAVNQIAIRISYSWQDEFTLVLLLAACGIYIVSFVLSTVFNYIHLNRGA